LSFEGWGNQFNKPQRKSTIRPNGGAIQTVIIDNFDAEGIQTSKTYDSVYENDLERFQHEHTFKAIDSLFELREIPPRRVVDIGCGQGQVLLYVYEKLRNMEAVFNPCNLIGIDISSTAIDHCEMKCSDLTWVKGSYQYFIANNLIENRERFDLIINKGGLLFVKDESEYIETIKNTQKTIEKAQGNFLHVQNHSFFSKRNTEFCGEWDNDVFYINKMELGDPIRFKINGYYADAYGRGLPEEKKSSTLGPI
jgi:SAM-dependent methyltransferase